MYAVRAVPSMAEFRATGSCHLRKKTWGGVAATPPPYGRGLSLNFHLKGLGVPLVYQTNVHATGSMTKLNHTNVLHYKTCCNKARPSQNVA